MGAVIETTDGHAPLVIEGGQLKPIRYEPPMASAQVKSAVLLAGLLAEGGPTRVVERKPTRDHTERLLRELGVAVRRRGAEISVSPVDSLPPVDVRIAGDFSSAAPFVVAATLLSGSELLVQGVNVNPTRTGLLGVLERMGANIAVFNRRTEGGEPVADLEVRSAPLTATQVDADEVPQPDRRAAPGRARRRAGPRRDGRPRRRRAPRKGNGPDRNRDNFAESPWRAHRGER